MTARGSSASYVLPSRTTNGPSPRRYMGLEILAACRKAVQPGMGKNGTRETGLTIEAIPT